MNAPEGLRAHDLVVELSGHRILDGVSIDLAPGERVAVIGPNGSGKSTLLRCLYAWLQPLTGTVLFDGRDLPSISQRERARNISVMTQETAAGLGMSVSDVVGLGRLVHSEGFGGLSASDQKLIGRLLIDLRLSDLSARPFSGLSGGEKQRTMFARALAQSPQVLILDEPTNHLDVGHQFDLLEIATQSGASVIASLHDINLAARWAERIYLMDGGQIRVTGSPEDALDPQVIGSVYGVDVERDADPRTGAVRLSFYPRKAGAAA